MAIYAIRVAEKGNTKWVVRAGRRHMHVVKDDETMLGILARPHNAEYRVYMVNYDMLKSFKERKRFISDDERDKVLNAVVDLLTLADDFRGEPALCTNGSYDTVVKYCEGDEVI